MARTNIQILMKCNLIHITLNCVWLSYVTVTIVLTIVLNALVIVFEPSNVCLSDRPPVYMLGGGEGSIEY